MPTLIPSLPIPPTPAASAAGEAKVLLAFQSLRDDFRIYHRKSWYSFDGPDGSREGVCEGEADFLVLHPDLGMLVLEVKGGRIAFDGRTGAWTSTARDGRVYSIKDPFLQAQRSVKAIAAKAAALSFEGQAMPEFARARGRLPRLRLHERGRRGERAARAGDRRGGPRAGRGGAADGDLPALGRAACGGTSDEEVGEEARAARPGAALLAGAGARVGAGVGGEGGRPRRSWESGSTRWWWTRRRTS
jgi:hypothetical protein